jgi:hypothetical protein
MDKKKKILIRAVLTVVILLAGVMAGFLFANAEKKESSSQNVENGALTNNERPVYDEKESTAKSNAKNQEVQAGFTPGNAWESDGRKYIQYELNIFSTGKKNIESWKIIFPAGSGTVMEQSWNCGVESSTAEDGTVSFTLSPVDYNREIPAGEHTQGIGFIISLTENYELKTYQLEAVIEGIQGVGGIKLPTTEFMKAIRQACDETNTVMILDEIQSGYGRSGKFFAHQYNDVRPDMITVAKGIGNGFPMAGVLISPKFTPVYGQLGTTFGGNHLACAAAIAVLDVMKAENLVENAGKVGTHLLEELKGFKGIKEVRGRGLMIGMEFEEPIKELRQKLLFEEKVFTGVSGTNVIRLLPPLCLSMNEADEFLTRLHRLIK